MGLSKLLSLPLFVFSVDLHAAAIASARSGAWAQPATWAGGAVPGAGDTAVISDGHTVSVSDARTVGASGGPGSVAIQIRSTGAIVIAPGGVLSVRGDTRYAGNGKDAVTVEGGGVWEFDSSQAPRVSYSFGPEGAGMRGFAAKGSARAYATVRSKQGGANGRFSLNAQGAGGSLAANYANFVHIGDAATPGWQVGYEYSGGHHVRWNATNSNFVACGAIASVNAMGVDDNGTFVHNFNVHRNTLSPEVFSKWITITTVAPGSGVREMRGNVFDVSMTRSAFYPSGFTITGNYFGDATLTGGYNPWASMSGNFLRYTDWWGASAQAMGLMGDLQHTYLFVDSDWGNPKPVIASATVISNLNGVIFGQAGTGLGPPGPKDSGELIWNMDPTAVAASGIFNSIFLPNFSGHSSLEIGSIVATFPHLRAVAEHNTWFGGWDRAKTQGQGGFPAVLVGEGGSGKTGVLTSFRGNILWNPQTNGYKSSFFKMADLSYSSAPTVDYCLPANCDFNAGYGHSAADKEHPQYSNQGKGYAAKFSSPPGAHDVDADPKFFDWQRSAELFDSKYLGNKPAAWSAGSAYKTGDFVQSADPAVYWALPVNYRYINGNSCQNANPKPGTGANWRACWEWASLYRLRQGVAAQQLIDDPAIGAKRDDIVTAMMKWIRAGYVPGNPALLDAAHDGYDIGAVQSCSSRRSQAAKAAGCAPSLKRYGK